MAYTENVIRVLQVNLAAFGYGGMSTMIYNLGQKSVEKSVMFDYVPAAPVKYTEYIDRIRAVGGRVYLPNFYPGISVLKRKWLFFKTIRKYLLKNHYKILHINVDKAYVALACAFVGKLCKTEIVVIHSHSTGVDGEKKSFGNFVKIFLHHMAKPFLPLFSSRYWGCSQEAVEWMVPKWAIQKYGSEIIRYGIEVDKYLYNEEIRESVRKNLGMQDDFVVGNIGRLSLQKNQFFLLKIFREILNKNKNAKLLLIGEGSLKESLKEYAQSLDIEKNVVFLENTQKVSDFLQAMDVFVFPSLFEGLGVVALEAQAAGVSTFISNGVPDEAMVSPYCKKLSLQETAESWACEILKSANWSYDKTQGVHDVKSAGYDLQQAAQRVCDLYRDYLKYI